MLEKLNQYFTLPPCYEQSEEKFWDDPHIAKSMLKEHLNPGNNGATRNHAFVQQSVNWIGASFPPAQYPKLMDLGCGPGIYAELFRGKGYQVSGLDLSGHSIGYATRKAAEKGLEIDYRCGNYLIWKEEEAYDFITLIWCDYGVLNPDERKTLLKNIYQGLKPGGVLLFDVFTAFMFQTVVEDKDFLYYQEGGFWSPEPHLYLSSTHLYDDYTVLRQHIVMTEEALKCYRLWEHYFTEEELLGELMGAGFQPLRFYGDVAGSPYNKASFTLCVTVKK